MLWYPTVSRRHLTRHLGSAILDVTIFSKSQEITQINLILSQHAYEMHKFVNFWNLIKKTGKKLKSTSFYSIMSKKLIFGWTYMKFAVTMATSKKTVTQLRYQNFCRRWMNSDWKFQPLRVNRIFINFKKPYATPPTSLVRPSLCKGITKVSRIIFLFLLIIVDSNLSFCNLRSGVPILIYIFSRRKKKIWDAWSQVIFTHFVTKEPWYC